MIFHTWSIVTGTRAPWSSHIAVIPRFRAIKPVRTELGVHFATSEDEAVEEVAEAFTAELEEIVRVPGSWKCCLRLQSLSIVGELERVGGKAITGAFSRGNIENGRSIKPYSGTLPLVNLLLHWTPRFQFQLSFVSYVSMEWKTGRTKASQLNMYRNVGKPRAIH